MTARSIGSYGALLVLAAIALVVVVHCGRRAPFSDDWDLVVPILDGEQRLGLGWLWAQHNEHRLPIPKLLLLASDAAARGDFRGGVVASWAMLVAIALGLLRTLERAAERSAERSGAAIPAWSGLALAAICLQPSNNALRWGVEAQFVSSAALMVAAMCACMRPTTATTVALAGVAAVLLPLTGGNGVLFAVAAIAATILPAMRAPATPRLRALGLALAALALVAIAAYLVGYHRPVNHEALITHSFASAAIVFVHVLLAPFGPYASRLAPLLGPLALVAVAAGAATLWRSYRADRSLLPVVAAVAATSAGSLAVFGAIAGARGARGWPPGLETHYAALGIPFWGVWCVALLRVGARLVPGAIAAAATALFLVALPTGPSPPWVPQVDAFRRDWCGGTPAPALADRYIDLLYWVDTPEARAIVAAHLTALRARPLPAWRCP